MPSFPSTLLFTLALSTLTAVKADAVSEIAALKTAESEVAKVNLLTDQDFVFDFFNATSGVSAGAGGHAVGASVSNFPALVGQGVAMTVGFLEACGMNTPHTHPRATEILYSVNGTMTSGTIGENGSRFVFNTISPGQATIFPKGSVHYQANEGCEPMTFVSAFNYEDPGTLSIAQRALGLPPDVVAASLGSLGEQDVVNIEAMIPDNFAIGRDECLQRCGLTRGAQPTTQRQPRVAGNPLPVSSMPALMSTASSTSTSMSVSASVTPAAAVMHRRAYHDVPEPESVYAYSYRYTDAAAFSALAMGLVGAMAAGYVVLAVLYLRDRAQRRAVRLAEALPAPVVQQYRYADKPSVAAV